MRGLSKGLLCLTTALFASAANADIVIDGQRLSIADIQNYTVSVSATGAYTIDITTVEGWVLELGTPPPPVDCDVTPDDPACQEPDPPPPPPPPAAGLNVTLAASTTTAEFGSTVTFTWTTQDAVACDTKWGNAQWKDFVPSAAGGSTGIVMDALGETQFRIRCTDAADNAQAVGVFVTVDQASGNAACLNNPPQVSALFETDWRDYLGAFYPNVSNAEQRKLLGRNNAVSVEFNTGNSDIRGLFQTIQVSDPNRFVSVSECKGRFTDAEPGCYNRQANGQEIQWSTDGTFGSCTLEKNKTYYLNITYVDVEAANGSTLCDTSSCAFNLKVVTQESP